MGQELEGKFFKWNNNSGAVSVHREHANLALELDRIGEEEEEEEEECITWDWKGFRRSAAMTPGLSAEATVADVPQCFSHFTYETTSQKRIVCDLQV